MKIKQYILFLIIFVACFSGFFVSAAAQDKPLTTAESSNYTTTSTYKDIMAFIRVLQQKSSLIRV